MGVIAEGILRGCQGLFTPVSLGYPISVFNKKLYSQWLGPKGFNRQMAYYERKYDMKHYFQEISFSMF